MPVIRTLFASQSTHWNHNKNKGTAPNSSSMNNTDNTHKCKDVQWQKKGVVNFFAFYFKEKKNTELIPDPKYSEKTLLATAWECLNGPKSFIKWD